MDYPFLSVTLLLGLLFIAVTAIIYKTLRLKALRKKHHVQIHGHLFTLYPPEYIFSTTSEKKREFMIASNRATYISITCFVITAILIAILFGGKLIESADAAL